MTRIVLRVWLKRFCQTTIHSLTASESVSRVPHTVNRAGMAVTKWRKRRFGVTPEG